MPNETAHLALITSLETRVAAQADRLSSQGNRIATLEAQVVHLRQEQNDAYSQLLDYLKGQEERRDEQRPPPIWESENGRRVIKWLVGGAVACCLALAGGLTSDQVLRYLGGSPSTETLVTPSAQVPGPPPAGVPQPAP